MSLSKPLNEGQLKAFNSIVEFSGSRNISSDKFYVLSGWAGTGKTYLMGALNNSLGRYGSIFTAPTNKATKVVAATIGKGATCKTIYSLLGIKMVADEDRMVLQFPNTPVDISAYDRIFVDECFMVGTELLNYIEQRSKFYSTKWIFVGDKGQLAPVGEKFSPVAKLKCPSSHLDKVERFDNEILATATSIRKLIQHYPKGELELSSDHSETEGVWKYNRGAFMRNIGRAAEKGMFTEIDNTKIVVWRNKTVEELNQFVRYHIHGEKADKKPWIAGDRVMIGEPVEEKGQTLAHIDDEGTVVSCEVSHHSVFKDFKAHFVTIDMDNGLTIVLNVLHSSSERKYILTLNELALKAKQDKIYWRDFWVLKNSFHKVRYSYALTSHRAQGSTFQNVFVDTTDILANSNSKEALRSLYVAATRPTTKLILT